MRKRWYILLIVVLVIWETGQMVVTRSISVGTTTALALDKPVEYASNPVNDLASHSISPVVMLTFDDGPNPVFTPQILHILEHYGVRATFFCIGSEVQADRPLVQQAFQKGNHIGNHTWNHPDLTKLSISAIRWQLQLTSTAIQQATGSLPTVFRPPYGATNATVREIAAQLGLKQVLWTIDTRDWQLPGVSSIVSTVLHNAHNGSIILMHDGGGSRSQTVQALPQIIRNLQQRGFVFGTL